jgi:hypothetical protein
MNGLSRRIVSGTVGPYTITDPADVLPPMPLLPARNPPTPGASASSSNTPVAKTFQESGGSYTGQTLFSNPQASQRLIGMPFFQSANSRQALLGIPCAPTAPKNSVYMPVPSWSSPDLTSSQSLVRTRPSSSETALSWVKDIFPNKAVRPYYDVAPLEPTPAVFPTFKYNNDAMDIVEEGSRVTQNLWDAAECAENDRLRLHAQSAPILQEPWKLIFGDDEEEGRPSIALPPERETTPVAPDEDNSQLFLRPVLPGARPASAHGGRRIRSEPMLEFSMPTPRFRRHVSGPENPGAR